MERARKVAEIWNWLPAFRAVAETEHLPAASELLRVSPSALSRTIRLLEDELGAELFERSGRQLKLNASGRSFLRVVRDAMRLVHDGMSIVVDAQFSGPVFVSALGPLARKVVVPAIRQVMSEHPTLVPHLVDSSGLEALPMLRRGQLDVALFSQSVEASDLDVARLGAAATHVYCGRGHPLFGEQDVDPARLTEHAFVAPAPDEPSPNPDGWPAGRSREVRLFVGQQEAALEVCRSGELLAVLPDHVAREWVVREELWVLAADVVPPTPLYAARRPSLGERGRADVVLDAIRTEVAAVDSIRSEN